MSNDITSLYAIFLEHPVISTDTRKITPGCIFFALKGANFDGNSFAAQAIDSGAAYAVVDDPSLKGPGFINTDDSLKSLQALANYHRRQFNVPLLAITGSNGKTTTKELVTTVLAQKYKVHATKGNLNNHIGVPLTLLGISPETEFVVCEMGANHPGEIAELCEIAEPTHGLITNIGKAHLEGFGSIEGVKNAKGELYAYLGKHHGFGFVNTDDPNLVSLSSLLGSKKTYGFEGTPQVHFSFSSIAGEGGFVITSADQSVTLTSSMFGQYNAMNVLAAYSVGNHFGVTVQQIADAISNYIPGSNRSEILNHHGCIVVKDAYNANPSSMELAVTAFAKQYPNGWIVLGDMKELGQDSEASHQHIIQLASSLNFGKIILVGKEFSAAFAQLSADKSKFKVFENVHALINQWHWKDCRDKALLLKGSRSMQLELLLDAPLN